MFKDSAAGIELGRSLHTKENVKRFSTNYYLVTSFIEMLRPVNFWLQILDYFFVGSTFTEVL